MKRELSSVFANVNEEYCRYEPPISKRCSRDGMKRGSAASLRASWRFYSKFTGVLPLDAGLDQRHLFIREDSRENSEFDDRAIATTCASRLHRNKEIFASV